MEWKGEKSPFLSACAGQNKIVRWDRGDESFQFLKWDVKLVSCILNARAHQAYPQIWPEIKPVTLWLPMRCSNRLNHTDSEIIAYSYHYTTMINSFWSRNLYMTFQRPILFSRVHCNGIVTYVVVSTRQRMN